jgi:GntR family transcriptional regulator
LDFSTSIPIYLQIIEEFKRQIAIGSLRPGDKIPSQRELALELKVNANTVQRAYREMEILGLVETLRGQGTFICQNPRLVEETKTEMLTNLIDEFLQAMNSLGYKEEAVLELLKERCEQHQISTGQEGSNE